MGKWLNGARVRKREIDGKDTRIAALAAANAAQTAANASTTKKDPVFSGSFSQNRKTGTEIGTKSHAEGCGCTAQGRNQHIQGKYNITSGTSNSIVDSDYAHIVGNGTSDSKRSNIHTLTWSGVPWCQDRPQFGGTAMDNGAQAIMANGDKEIIFASSTANSTKKFKITVDDSGALTATEITG